MDSDVEIIDFKNESNHCIENNTEMINYLNWLRKARLFENYQPPQDEVIQKQRLFGIHALEEIATNPQKYSDSIILLEDDLLVIYDAYPKGFVHMLILPRDTRITCAGALNKTLDNLFIDRLTVTAIWLIERCTVFFPKLTFKVGIHAQPSLRPLHVHIISQDLRGPWMKTGRLWNVFTTDFFFHLSKLRSVLGMPPQIHGLTPVVPLLIASHISTPHNPESIQSNGNRLDVDYKSDWHESILGFPQEYWLNLLKNDFICIRCNNNFGFQFNQLQRHLNYCSESLPPSII